MGYCTLEGISIRPYKIGMRGVIPVLLDAEGESFNSIQHPKDLGFILSDDQPFRFKTRPVFTV